MVRVVDAVAPDRRAQDAQVEVAAVEAIELGRGQQVGVDLQGDAGQLAT